MRFEKGIDYEDDIRIVHEETGASAVLAPPSRWYDQVGDSQDVWSIWCVGVPEKHRRQGVATQLVCQALKEAKDRGASAVRRACREELVGLYEKSGFKRYSRGSPTGRVYMEVEVCHAL